MRLAQPGYSTTNHGSIHTLWREGTNGNKKEANPLIEQY